MKKLIRNPFFIAAMLIALAGITALVFYLLKKTKKLQNQSPSLDSSPNQQEPSASSITHVVTDIPTQTVKVSNHEIIRLTKPYQRNSKIKKLQKGLNKKGHDLTEDGIYGEKTHAAALEEYPVFLLDGEISPDELITMLDAASEYNSTFAWTRPAISKTGESIASIVRNVSMDLSYDGTADAKHINASLSWWNDDEEAVKKTFYRLSKAQIIQLLVAFQSLYGQSLDDYLKGGLLWGLNDTEYDEVLSIVRSRP